MSSKEKGTRSRLARVVENPFVSGGVPICEGLRRGPLNPSISKRIPKTVSDFSVDSPIVSRNGTDQAGRHVEPIVRCFLTAEGVGAVYDQLCIYVKLVTREVDVYVLEKTQVSAFADIVDTLRVPPCVVAEMIY